MDQDATWYGARSRPRRHCVRWGHSVRLTRGTAPTCRPMCLWPNGRPSHHLLLSTCSIFIGDVRPFEPTFQVERHVPPKKFLYRASAMLSAALAIEICLSVCLSNRDIGLRSSTVESQASLKSLEASLESSLKSLRANLKLCLKSLKSSLDSSRKSFSSSRKSSFTSISTCITLKLHSFDPSLSQITL